MTPPLAAEDGAVGILYGMLVEKEFLQQLLGAMISAEIYRWFIPKILRLKCRQVFGCSK